MLIRPFRPEDASACIRILHDNFHQFKESQGGYIPDSVVDQRLIGGYTFDELLARASEHRYWVAVDRGKVLGVAGLTRPNARSAELVNFYISPSAARKGIGRQLLERVVEHARASDIRHIFLFSVLTAHDAYEKLGFTHQPRQDKFLRRAQPDGFNARFACNHWDVEKLTAKPKKLDQYYFEMRL